MVYLYAANISNLPDPKEYPEIMNGLDSERKEKILRYKQLEDRKQSTGAGLLLKHVLTLYGFSTKNIKYGIHGKPEIDGIFFNLSHSGNIVICAVSKMPVGCDIEQISRIKEGIAEHFFTANEIQYLNSFEEERKQNEFFRLWTMKEAYIKMTGEGMSLAFNRFEFDLEENVKIYRDGESCSCRIKEYGVTGYKISVCAKEEVFSNEIEYIEL